MVLVARIRADRGVTPMKLRPISEMPEELRDGREVLCTDGDIWRVCRPKLFRPDVWEYFRDCRNPTKGCTIPASHTIPT